MNILVLTKYDSLGASSRLRFIQYLPYLKTKGTYITHNYLISNSSLQGKYKSNHYSYVSTLKQYFNRFKILLQSHKYDLIWIEAECFPYMPVSIELLLLGKTPFVLEYDDAIFHNYDMHRNFLVRLLLGNRIDQLMGKASLVIAGNKYLQERALKAGCKKVEIIPTVVDFNRYANKRKLVQSDNKVRVVWIGTKSTLKYLEYLIPTLRKVYKEVPFILRVIGVTLNDDFLEIENIVWTEDSEVESIQGADIGIMPLIDSSWERGKCGYKLIQYMACGLPVIASAVGVNIQIVEQSKSGYLVSSFEDWEMALISLIKNRDSRDKYGNNGLLKVQDSYSLQVYNEKLFNLFDSIVHPVISN